MSTFTEPEPLRELHRWLTEQIHCAEWALNLHGDAGELTGNRGMRWHRQRGYLAGLREARDALRATVRKMEANANATAAELRDDRMASYLRLEIGKRYRVTYPAGSLVGVFERITTADNPRPGKYVFVTDHDGRRVAIAPWEVLAVEAAA